MLRWKRMLWAHPSNKAEWVTVGDFTAKVRLGTGRDMKTRGWLWTVETKERVLRIGFSTTNRNAKKAAAAVIARRIRG